MPDHESPGETQFPHIFQPFAFRTRTVRNRIAISGHHAGWWIDHGKPGPAFAAYVAERCDRGAGLFVIGATSPMPGSGWFENIDDSIIPAYGLVTEAAHAHNTVLIAQLCHPGFEPRPGIPLTMRVPAAAPIQPSYTGPPRHVPSIAELRHLVQAFGAAAGRAARGGVDGVEVHSHEWFLHSQMLNPMWNQRTDEYGGPLENRMRFLVETLTAMRREVGSDLLLGVRLKADDMEQRGMDADAYIECIRLLEPLGLLDYINLTAGDGRLHHGPDPRPEGEWLDLVKRVRESTRIPIMHAGRICTPEMAERALADGATDIVCMTKTHIADAHFTRKVWEGRLHDIRFCTRCLQACHGKMDKMTCVYNPLTSRELDWATAPLVTVQKHIVIIGAGPAGMECAITAAARGHRVTVLEQSERIGGQIWLGAATTMRSQWVRIAEFYQRQAETGNFTVRLNTRATAETILRLKPDAVVVATGSTPVRAEIPGSGHVTTVTELLTSAPRSPGRVLVLDREGGSRAQVAADFLAQNGCKVWFVSPLHAIGPDIEGWVRDEWLRRLLAHGVEFLAGFELRFWEPEKVAIARSRFTGEERAIPSIGTVVVLDGSVPNDSLSIQLRGAGVPTHTIGDANSPAGVELATFQGANIGRLL